MIPIIKTTKFKIRLLEIMKSLLQDGSGEIEIGEFCQLCATFLVEDPDMETMKRELKDAFRSPQSCWMIANS
jgi:hypothetical protein